MWPIPTIRTTVRIMNVTQQVNRSNCGVLAIAFAYDLCSELDPCLVEYDQGSTTS